MKKLWTEKRIKQGFEKFISLYDHLPTAHEIDTFEHLPTSRYIQKKFGGLEVLRQNLGYEDAHLGKSDFRSRIATEAGERSRQQEADLEIELQSLFTADCVQTEKSFFGKKRIDFYVTTTSHTFGIDIFYAKNMRTLQSSVNIKMKRYEEFTQTLYLTVANETISQTQLEAYVQNKKNALPENIHLVTLKTLRAQLKSIQEEDLLGTP